MDVNPQVCDGIYPGEKKWPDIRDKLTIRGLSQNEQKTLE